MRGWEMISCPVSGPDSNGAFDTSSPACSGQHPRAEVPPEPKPSDLQDCHIPAVLRDNPDVFPDFWGRT